MAEYTFDTLFGYNAAGYSKVAVAFHSQHEHLNVPHVVEALGDEMVVSVLGVLKSHR